MSENPSTCSAAISMLQAELFTSDLIAATETIGGFFLERIYYKSVVAEEQTSENIKIVEDVAPQLYSAIKGGKS